MANICPHCKERAIVRTSERLSAITRRMTYQCTNVQCAHTFVAMEEVVRTICASAIPDPQITLPVHRPRQPITT